MSTLRWEEARASWAEAGMLFDVEEHVATVTLNRPERRNAIDKTLRQALLEAAGEIAGDPAIRAAVVTGAGTAFSAGADLLGQDPIELPPDRRRGRQANFVHDDAVRYGWWRLATAIWENPKPFVAAVNGPAVGAGCQLALACDLVVISEEAYLQEIFIHRGLPLEAGAAYMLPRAVGLYRAKEIALLGERVEASDAAAWGLANRTAPADRLMEAALDLARQLAARPSIALGHIKQQLNAALDQSLPQAYRSEATYMALGGGEDQIEAMRAFAERRPPRFTGN